ncbi:MAG TPA: aminoglycoside phosphotransferase family protein [Acidimicrobiales bacterium]|nr:aminoglycoside phosphotransferase family protein [Acidimicrobiales bacterium]
MFLRRRPPASTLRWVEQRLGERVTRVEARRGGSSSAIHALTVGDSRVILRRYVIPDVIEEEPDIIDQERRALRVLERSAAVTPKAILSDETGVHADVPALVMSCLSGRVNWTPANIEGWLRQLAEALPPIHATPHEADDGIRAFRPYRPDRWEPPPWLRDRSIWDRAVAVFHAPPADDAEAFINRDYHPGNVLFRRGKVTGVVDWQSAAIGPPSVDVSHCRGNLIGRFGLEVADRFTKVWQDVSGEVYHPWAEAAMAIDALGWHGTSGRPHRERQDLETSIARALAELGA